MKPTKPNKVTSLIATFDVSEADTLETMVTHVETALASETSLKSGDQVVVISGFPVGAFSSSKSRPSLHSEGLNVWGLKTYLTSGATKKTGLPQTGFLFE